MSFMVDKVPCIIYGSRNPTASLIASFDLLSFIIYLFTYLFIYLLTV